MVFYFTPDSFNGQSKEETNSTCIRSSARPRTVVVTCLSARRLDQVGRCNVDGDQWSKSLPGPPPRQRTRALLKNEQRRFFLSFDRPGGASDSRCPRNPVRNEDKAKLKLIAAKLYLVGYSSEYVIYLNPPAICSGYKVELYYISLFLKSKIRTVSSRPADGIAL